MFENNSVSSGNYSLTENKDLLHWHRILTKREWFLSSCLFIPGTAFPIQPSDPTG